MPVRRRTARGRGILAGSIIVFLGCQGSTATGADPSPASAPVAGAGAEAKDSATPKAGPPQATVPTRSCEELEQAFETEARALARACSTRADCSLQWSDYNCYAIRSTGDDVTGLERVDAAMKTKGCSEVECEPPPNLACKSGRCEWDL